MTSPAFLGPLLLENPLEIDEGRKASFALARQRRDAEDAHARLVEDAAEKQRLFRRKLAESFMHAKGDTAAHREADAKSLAADAEYAANLAAGLVKAQIERLRGLEGERAQLQSLISWSARMHLDERPS